MMMKMIFDRFSANFSIQLMEGDSLVYYQCLMPILTVGIYRNAGLFGMEN